MLIKAIEHAHGQSKTELIQWLKKKDFNPEEKVMAVIDIYNNLGIKELSENKMNLYFDKGLEILDSLELKHQKKAPLNELVLKLIDREK